MRRRFLAIILAVGFLAAACAGSDDGGIGPTADEQNTIAVAARFGPSTAALSVVGLLGFFAAQSQHFFDVPLGFLFVTIVTLGILLTMPSSDAGR